MEHGFSIGSKPTADPGPRTGNAHVDNSSCIWSSAPGVAHYTGPEGIGKAMLALHLAAWSFAVSDVRRDAETGLSSKQANVPDSPEAWLAVPGFSVRLAELGHKLSHQAHPDFVCLHRTKSEGAGHLISVAQVRSALNLIHVRPVQVVMYSMPLGPKKNLSNVR